MRARHNAFQNEIVENENLFGKGRFFAHFWTGFNNRSFPITLGTSEILSSRDEITRTRNSNAKYSLGIKLHWDSLG
jgi:hypothetical protein